MAGPGEMIRLLPQLPALMRWMRLPLKDFGARFRDPFLRRAFPCVQYDMPDAPVAVSLIFLAGMHRGDLGWVEGDDALLCLGASAGQSVFTSSQKIHRSSLI